MKREEHFAKKNWDTDEGEKENITLKYYIAKFIQDLCKFIQGEKDIEKRDLPSPKAKKFAAKVDVATTNRH